EALPEGAMPRPADVRAMAALWAHPLDSSAGLDEERADFIARADDLTPSPRWRLALFLEAVRPSQERVLPREDAGFLVEQVGFGSWALAGTVAGLLHTVTFGIDPVPRLREAFRSVALAGLDALKGRLASVRLDLHQTVKQMWKAAGGTIQRT